jgi:hypothetical protein
MPDQLFAIFFIGHPTDDDYAGWLRQRLAYARMEFDGLEMGEANGTWGGVPCHARHLDDADGGPLLLAYAVEDFEAAMKLPPMNDDELPPPLATFADACRGLRPNVALLASEPLPDASIYQYAADLAAQIADGPSAELCARSFTALFLGSFEIVMLEDEQPLLAELHRLDVAGGAVFFPAGTPGPGLPTHEH